MQKSNTQQSQRHNKHTSHQSQLQNIPHKVSKPKEQQKRKLSTSLIPKKLRNLKKFVPKNNKQISPLQSIILTQPTQSSPLSLIHSQQHSHFSTSTSSWSPSSSTTQNEADNYHLQQQQQYNDKSTTSASSIKHDHRHKNPIDVLSTFTTPAQLVHHFRDMTLSATSIVDQDEINLQFDTLRTDPKLTKLFPKLPSSLYTSMLEANLANNNFNRVHAVLKDSLHHHVKLPPNTLSHTFKQLSQHGQVPILEETISILHEQIQSNTNNTAQSTQNQQQQQQQVTNLSSSTLLDPHTTSQLKEALVLSYVNKNRLQDSVHALVQNFGPGSGSIPSDYLLDTIVQSLLRYRRPRHAHQLISKFDVYCTPKTKSKLYSRIALSFLEVKLPEQLNQTLAYMEQNDISPHPSMMEQLLAHVVQNTNPLSSLKWYSNLYPSHTIPAHLQHEADINNPNGTNDKNQYDQYGAENNTQRDNNNTTTTNNNNQNNGFNIKAANTILKSLFHVNHHHQGLDFLPQIPTHISTVNVLLQSQYDNRDWDSMRLTLKYMLLRGLPLDQQGLHILIQSLSFHTHPAALTTLLDTLTLSHGVKLHPLTYNLFIRALKTQGYPKLCEHVLLRMQSVGEQPDVASYTLVMQAYLDQGLFREAFRLKEGMEMSGISPNLHLYSILLDSLVKAGDALTLYHTLAELFDRADDLINQSSSHQNEKYQSDKVEDSLLYNPSFEISKSFQTTHKQQENNNNSNNNENTRSNQTQGTTNANNRSIDFHSLPQTFPKATKLLLQTQNDQSFTNKQRFLAYVRTYVKAACHLLSASGYKRYSDTLASFYLSSGGSTVNQKLAVLGKNIQLQQEQKQKDKKNDNTNTTTTTTTTFNLVSPSALIDHNDVFGTSYDDGINEVLTQISNNKDTKPSDSLSLLHRQKVPSNLDGHDDNNDGDDSNLHIINNIPRDTQQQAKSLPKDRLRQLYLQQNSFGNEDVDTMLDTINETFSPDDNGNSNDAGSILDSIQHKTGRNYATIKKLANTAHGMDQNDAVIDAALTLTNFQTNDILNKVLQSSSSFSSESPFDNIDDPFDSPHYLLNNRSTSYYGARKQNSPHKMFNVACLDSLPANVLSDYIDRTDTVAMHREQDIILRAQYSGSTGSMYGDTDNNNVNNNERTERGSEKRERRKGTSDKENNSSVNLNSNTNKKIDFNIDMDDDIPPQTTSPMSFTNKHNNGNSSNADSTNNKSTSNNSFNKTRNNNNRSDHKNNANNTAANNNNSKTSKKTIPSTPNIPQKKKTHPAVEVRPSANPQYDWGDFGSSSSTSTLSTNSKSTTTTSTPVSQSKRTIITNNKRSNRVTRPNSITVPIQNKMEQLVFTTALGTNMVAKYKM